MTSTGPESAPPRTGSLQPVEFAQAAVMAALCAAIAIIAVVVPFAAGLSLLGTVPMGLLAFRYRLRVLIAATVAGALIAFLIAGMGGFMTVLNCAYIGGLTGIVKRRGRGTPTVFAPRSSRVRCSGGHRGRAGPPVPAASPDVRFGDRQHHRARRDPRPHPWVAGCSPSVSKRTSRRCWTTGRSCSSASVSSASLGQPGRLVGVVAGDDAAARRARRPQAGASADTGPVAPVPLQLNDVRFRYPTADHDALGPVSLTVQPGEHLAVTGANGSGKTTLMLVLSGRDPRRAPSNAPVRWVWAGSAAPRW